MDFVTNLWNNNRPLAMLIAGIIIVIPFLIFYVRKALSEQGSYPRGIE